MSVEEHRALVLRFYELMSKQQFDAMFELMADDAVALLPDDLIAA